MLPWPLLVAALLNEKDFLDLFSFVFTNKVIVKAYAADGEDNAALDYVNRTFLRQSEPLDLDPNVIFFIELSAVISR